MFDEFKQYLYLHLETNVFNSLQLSTNDHTLVFITHFFGLTTKRAVFQYVHCCYYHVGRIGNEVVNIVHRGENIR